MLLATLAIALLAQPTPALFEQAPPDVEQALRARINKFYQAQMDGKFTQALTLVAPDSQDAYLGADKDRCRKFGIISLKFSDRFTRANAVVGCDTDFMADRPIRVNRPLPTNWKLVDTEWCWYVEPSLTRDRATPWGTMSPGPGGAGSSPLAMMGAGPSPAAVQNAVRASKKEILLSSYQAASEEVTLTNTMTGAVTLSLEKLPVQGFEVALDRTELKANESARLSFRYAPPDKSPKPTQTVRVRVQPTAQAIVFEVKFAIPPEVQKLIPKN